MSTCIFCDAKNAALYEAPLSSRPGSPPVHISSAKRCLRAGKGSGLTRTGTPPHVRRVQLKGSAISKAPLSSAAERPLPAAEYGRR